MSEKLFEIKTIKSIIIKNLFETIKPYIKETNMIISNEGIKIMALDTSKISLTHIKLDAENFEVFNCKKPMIIGIDTVVFFKTIKSANRRETFTLYMNANDEDKLVIELSDPYIGEIRSFKIPILDLNDDKINISPLIYDYKINIPSTQFQQIIKNIHLLEGKIVEIKSIGKQLIFKCVDGVAEITTAISEIDQDLNKKQKALLQQNGEDIRSVKFEKTNNNIVQGTFKMTHLMYFIKASHLCENMNIRLSNDKPLHLEYFIASLGTLSFLLASSNT